MFNLGNLEDATILDILFIKYCIPLNHRTLHAHLQAVDLDELDDDSNMGLGRGKSFLETRVQAYLFPEGTLLLSTKSVILNIRVGGY